MFFDEWDFNDETEQLCWKLFYLEAALTMTGSDAEVTAATVLWPII